MKKDKLYLAGLLITVIGLTLVFSTIPQLWVNKSVNYASGTVLMEPNLHGTLVCSNSPYSFHTYTDEIKNVKQVEVIVTPVRNFFIFGASNENLTQLIHPFEITLVNTHADVDQCFVSYKVPSSGLASGPVTHIFNIPDQWDFLEGVSVENPENEYVVVAITVILQKQVIEILSLGYLILGITVAVLGLITVGLVRYHSLKSNKTKSSQKEGVVYEIGN